ncbi:hypothetical protein [Kribbella sp. NPDC004536]|uniref:hypothetical protein n=1 Tax=Kribbella sp. NPDC004536 TaxID=3364106 RepID=UPI0036C3EFBB
MTTIRFTEVTTLTPAQFIAGLTDFGPGRAEIFANSHDDDLKVHSQGPGYADVTEGSGGVWERLSYDWSNQHHIVLTTTDSNVWGGASSHTYTLKERGDGTTEIDVVIVRDGKNLKGHLIALAFAAGGKRVIHKAFDNSIRAMEARNVPLIAF